MSDNKSSLNFIILGLLALILGLWFGLGTDFHKPYAPDKAPTIGGVILPTAKILGDFSLQDHSGQVFNKQSLKGNWTIVFMGYTQCPDVCPATLSIMKQTVAFMNDKSEDVPQTVFVSVDPDRDTPEKLAEYVTYFNSDFKGVTGAHDQLKKLALELSVYYKKSAGSSGDVNADDYLMDHSAALMLINPEGNLQAFLTAPHDPAKITDSIIKTREFYNQK